MAKSPFSTVKEKFGDENPKAKLVSAIEEMTKGDELWVSRLNGAKGLAHVSNAKLLRLHATFTAVKEKFGTRAKLIDAILDLEKRTKDAGYKTRLEKHPVPRLYDQYRAASKREAAKTAPKKVAKKAAPGEAPAKKGAAPAKKTAAKKAAAPAKKAAAAKKAAKKGGSKKR